MNISSKNLNLLNIFLVLTEENSLTKASQRLGLSQPALSHALGRLRDEFRDPLFVRVSHGLSPTPKAEALAPKVRRVLDAATALYRDGDPAEFLGTRRSVTIASTGYFELRILVRVLSVLEVEAPFVTMNTRSLQGEFPRRELETGAVDLAIAAYFHDAPAGCHVALLGDDPHVCIMRKDHPFLGTPQTLDDYLACRHLVIAIPPGVPQKVDEGLALHGKPRSVAVNVSNFLTPPWALSSTDYILTCPQTLAEQYAAHFELVVRPLPLSIPPITVRMVWHERQHQDPFHKWLRQLVRASINQRDQGPLKPKPERP